jgi:hypothetical protein
METSMIENEAMAKEINALMLECSAVGKVMGEILLGIMNPLYQRHPNLKPKELLKEWHKTHPTS